MKKYYRFILSFIFLFLSCLLLEHTKQLSDKEHYDLMYTAAVRTQAAFEAVKTEKQARGLPISRLDDPNETGLIGDEYTEITTTLGNLESKRSTTNPNISAMITDMLVQCGVKSGDTVAVNLSSSFPAVNLAVLCALDAMEVKGIIISSVGASTYGGNIPDFTYLDMEHYLYANGYITNHSTHFSMGGINDQGKEMPDALKDSIKLRLTGYGLEFLNYDDLTENTKARMLLYRNQGSVSCFINAGGNSLSFGDGDEMVGAKNGIILPGTSGRKSSGLVPAFLEEDIPVIHLLNMKGLLPTYGLPIDPMPIPPVGSGGVYQYYKYNIPLAVILLLLNAAWILRSAKKLPHRRFPI